MKKAVIGDHILFRREQVTIEGNVVKVYENSVMVEINEEYMDKIKIPHNKTIVNHKNYSLKK